MNMFTPVLLIITRGQEPVMGSCPGNTQQSFIGGGSAPKSFLVEKVLPLSYTLY